MDRRCDFVLARFDGHGLGGHRAQPFGCSRDRVSVSGLGETHQPAQRGADALGVRLCLAFGVGSCLPCGLKTNRVIGRDLPSGSVDPRDQLLRGSRDELTDQHRIDQEHRYARDRAMAE